MTRIGWLEAALCRAVILAESLANAEAFDELATVNKLEVRLTEVLKEENNGIDPAIRDSMRAIPKQPPYLPSTMKNEYDR